MKLDYKTLTKKLTNFVRCLSETTEICWEAIDYIRDHGCLSTSQLENLRSIISEDAIKHALLDNLIRNIQKDSLPDWI